MKKILTIILATALFLAFGVVCFGAEPTDAQTEANVFAIAYEWAYAHAAEILSALTLIGSLVLAITYKKGLLPKLSGALTRIGSSVSELGDGTKKILADMSEKIDTATGKSEITEGICQNLADEVSALSARLSEVDAQKGEREKMRLIILSQIEMLYDIFMTSALPQYSKDAVGERVAAMKAALEDGEAINE